MTANQANPVALTAQNSVLVAMSERYGMDPRAFEATLRATVIKPDKTGREARREEFAAFLLVAKEYGLNPLTKEIYAFADKGAVVPIVSIDGWANIINSHPQFDGMSFIDHADDGGSITAITCRMFRKDRSHPIEVTEYLSECRRQTDPWQRWPRRMLRHKAMIQAARYAFGFAGIYDQDEAERISETPARSDRMAFVQRLQARLNAAPASDAGFSAEFVDRETGEIIENGTGDGADEAPAIGPVGGDEPPLPAERRQGSVSGGDPSPVPAAADDDDDFPGDRDATLIEIARGKAMAGRRAFDAWWASLSRDQQDDLKPEMPALMAAAKHAGV